MIFLKKYLRRIRRIAIKQTLFLHKYILLIKRGNMNIRTLILILAIQFLFVGCALKSGKMGCRETKECDYVEAAGAEKIVAIRSTKPFVGILMWDMPSETQARIKNDTKNKAKKLEEQEFIYTCEYMRIFLFSQGCKAVGKGYLDYSNVGMGFIPPMMDDVILAAKSNAKSYLPETTHISYNFPETGPGKHDKLDYVTWICPEGHGRVILNKDLAKLEEDLVFDPKSVALYEDELFKHYGLGGNSWSEAFISSSCQEDRENFIKSVNEEKAELKKEEDELKKEEEEIMKE